jgi:hypothetical protein
VAASRDPSLEGKDWKMRELYLGIEKINLNEIAKINNPCFVVPIAIAGGEERQGITWKNIYFSNKSNQR